MHTAQFSTGKKQNCPNYFTSPETSEQFHEPCIQNWTILLLLLLLLLSSSSS